MASDSGPEEGASPQQGKAMVLSSPFQRKQDVFDAEDFQAAKLINQLYPDEASLGDLDKFMDVLRKQIKAVDREIFAAVRQQSGSQARSRHDLGVATGQVGDLFARVRDIQRKAADTELLVQEICRDIRKLDYAKRHLTSTITSLRRLAMLTAAVDDLEQVGYRRDQYKRCANLLEAVGQLMEHFERHRALPKIASLTRRLETVQRGLQEAVMDDFKLLLGTNETRLSADNAERLANACLVVNALGPKVRDCLMDWLCDREMTVYQTIFSMSGDAAKLDRFERRFVWFKSRMEERKEVWALFPPSWRVPQTLTLTFCKITKASLKRILSDSEDVIASDVGPLLKTVVATNKFEREMAAAFGGGSGAPGGEAEEGEEGAELQDMDNLPAAEARRRLEAFRKRQQAAAAAAARAAAGAGEGGAGGAAEAAAAAAARGAFEGAISEAFEGALKFYVAEEQKELFRYLDQLIREEGERKWTPPDDADAASSRVLGSANALFLKIRASLTRCVKLVSRGPTLLGLAGAFKRVLSAYAAELLKRLPKTAAGGTSANPPYLGTDWHVRMPEEEEAVVCRILHTSEYCRDTIEGLAAAISKDLRPPTLAEGLDFGDEEGAFSGVAAACLSVLVLGLNTRLDGPLQDMLRMRWDAIETPGDDSPFVGAMRKVLAEAAPRLGSVLDRTQFGFLCDKAGRVFVPRYVDAIYRLRKISEKGTLQLAIDTDSVRRLLLEFPRAARPLDSGGGGDASLAPDTAAYAHYVEREMGGAMGLVKVLQAHPENLLDTFLLLMPPGQRGAADFARVCDLKGFTRKLTGELLVQFSRKTGAPVDPLGAMGGGGGGAGGGAGPGGGGAAALGPLGGGGGSGPLGGGSGIGGAAGAVGGGGGNLSALKSSVNILTRELASSMSLGVRQAAAGGGSGDGGGAGRGGGGGGLGLGSGSGQAPTLFRPGGGLGFSMGQTAARTREGLAKILQGPGKFGGGGGASGSGGGEER